MTLFWEKAADDVFTYLGLGKGTRIFTASKMLAVLDDLVMRGEVTQAELMRAHGSENLIATTLANVTTAIHGKGSVPKHGGWYSRTTEPYGYKIEPAFAEAWRRKRPKLNDSATRV